MDKFIFNFIFYILASALKSCIYMIKLKFFPEIFFDPENMKKLSSNRAKFSTGFHNKDIKVGNKYLFSYLWVIAVGDSFPLCSSFSVVPSSNSPEKAAKV